jgi:hypothetical protein
MIVIMCGDRNWNNFKIIERVFSSFPITKVIHGDCRGADKISGYIAHCRGIEVIPVPAKWELFGKGAGPRRNREMLTYNPELVIAFHDNIENSKGTKDMINAAIADKRTVFLVQSNGVCNRINRKV